MPLIYPDELKELGIETTIEVLPMNDLSEYLDIDSDGFVDGTSNYQLFDSGTAVDLTNKSDKTISDSSSPNWNAVKAVKISAKKFKVLIEGVAGNRANQFYVWTTNNSGRIKGGGSGWKTGDQMMQLGYEDIFGINMNGNPGIGV